jgi:hypothetical protein
MHNHNHIKGERSITSITNKFQMASKTLLIIYGILSIAVMINAAIDDQCLACICQVESNCTPKECSWDVYSNSCGYYQIKETYWQDCGSPGDSFVSCAYECVRSYMDRYAELCTGGNEPTCEDYARIHNEGPKGCQRSSTDGYWATVSACYS